MLWDLSVLFFIREGGDGDVQGCQHVAGADTIDSNAMRGPLNCQAAGEMSHRGL